MHPAIATAVALQHQADLLRAAEHHRRARLVRAARPARRPALATLTASATETAQRLRLRAAQQLGPRSARRSAVEPCCA
jgi:hypothetical protein